MGTNGYYGNGTPSVGQICPDYMLRPLAIGWQHAWWAASRDQFTLSSYDVLEWFDLTGDEWGNLSVVGDQQGSPLLDVDAPYLNSKDAVYFSGAGGARALGRSLLPIAQPDSIVVICSTSGATNRIIDPGFVSGRQIVGYGGAPTYTGMELSNNGTEFITPDPPSWPVSRAAVIAAVFDGAASFVWQNGVQSIAVDTGTTGIDNFAIGGIEATGRWMTGSHVAFVGIYSGDVTADPAWPLFVAQAQFDYGISF